MDKVEILAQYFNINRSDLIEEKPPGALTTRDEREVIEFHCTKLIQLICWNLGHLLNRSVFSRLLSYNDLDF